MHSRLLVSGLPRSLPSLPRSPAPPCLPCVEGWQRAAPHSSEFPPTNAPLQTLHMDVWGPAPVGGADQERYFLLVVDDYTRYTTVSPLWRKADVSGAVCSLLASLRLDEGIYQTFTLPASLQQNGIAERRIFLFMEIARTSMIHAAAPHFLWPFASDTLRISSTSGLVSLSQRLRPHSGRQGRLAMRRCFGSGTRSPLFAMPKRASSPLALSAASSLASPPMPSRGSSTTCARIESSPPRTSGHAPSRVSQVDPPPLVEPLEISSDSSGPSEGGDPAADDMAATRRSPRLETPPSFPPRPSSPPLQPAAVDSRAETAGAEPGGAETEGEGSGGAAHGGAATEGATTGGADSRGAASPSGSGAVGDPAGGPRAGQPPHPDLLETFLPQATRAWIVRRGSPGGGGYGPAGAGAASPRGAGGTAGGTRGAAGAGGTGAARHGGTGGAAGAGVAGATSPGGTTGAGGAGPTSPGGTAGAGGAGAAGTGGAVIV
ncbi:unnamed protein product [Closterium sp. NIES-53]